VKGLVWGQAAALVAVKALKLDPADADLPKIETMKVEDVIAAVVKTKGGCGDGICGAGECYGGDDPESDGGRAEASGRGNSGTAEAADESDAAGADGIS
jgi:hypothetical protein